MTQANDTSSEAAAVTDAVADDRSSSMASLGDKLRLAREQRSLSLEQVSEALHLDAAIIVSLEQGRFDAFGAPVYVRGHLKTYARLLGLSPDDIVSEYQGGSPEPFMAPTLQQPGVVAPVTFNPVLLAGGGLAIVLGLLLGFYVLFGGETPGRAEKPAAPGIVAAPQIVTKPPQPVIKTEVVEATPLPIPVARPAATMRVGLQFTQEAWVEISDANRRLLFGLQREGDHREISGEPPFNLLIGNVRAVELTVNNEPFAVPASNVRGKVARFRITGKEMEQDQ